MTSIDKLLDSFPYPTVTLIIGKPTWESIRAMHLELNANAASFQFHISNGRVGPLFLTVLSVVFNTLSHILLVLPTNSDLDSIMID